ncbi:MAG: CHAD domain-containing protein [Planctomycetota bacterium]
MNNSETGQHESWFELSDIRPVALQTIREHLRPLRKRLERQRGWTVSDVHEARVEIRRARSALGLFQVVLGAKRVRQLEGSLREMGQVLGPIRDLDVVVERSLIWNLPRRGEAQVEFLYRVACLREELLADAERKFRARFGAGAIRAGQRLLSSDAVSGGAWRRFLESEIRTALLSLVAPLENSGIWSASQAPPAALLEQWHQRRKVCRQLRYQLEMLGSATPCSKAIEFLRGAQVRFGAVQDSAFILERVRGDLGQLMKRRLREAVLELEQRGLQKGMADAEAWWVGTGGWEQTASSIAAGLKPPQDADGSISA